MQVTGPGTQDRTATVEIAAPVEVAFACVKDPTTFNELMPGVAFTDVTLSSTGVGTRYRFETRVAGIRVRGSGEFTEFEADRHIRDETSNAVEGSFDWWFEPHNDGVRVTIEHHPGRFWDLPVVGRLIADVYARADRRVLEQLKEKLEATGP